MTTPRLGAPELTSGQATPETTVNEQIRYMESGTGHFVLEDRDLSTPPGSPVDGTSYLVAGTGTGAWVGHDGDIAYRLNTAWVFINVVEGFTFWVKDENVFLVATSATTFISILTGAAYADENARDAIGAALIGGDGIEVDPDDLTDTITLNWKGGEVNVGTPANGEVLTWDDGTGEWVAAAAPGSGGGAGGTVPNGGATSQVLMKDTGVDQDVSWQYPGLTLLSEQSPSGTGTVTFSSISGAYRDLVVVVRGRGSTAANNVNVGIEMNADTTAANYERVRAGTVNGGSTVSGSSASDTICGTLPAASATSGCAGSLHIEVYDYKGTTFHKQFFSNYGGRMGVALSDYATGSFSGRWKNAAAVTQVDIKLVAGNFDAGSVVSLYGRI